MERGAVLALSATWWAWNHPQIRSAVAFAFTEHYGSVVMQRLRENREKCDKPASWKEFGELLRRNDRNAERLGSGRYVATPQLLLGMASILTIPVRKLLPRTRDWIECVTCELCEGTVTRPEAQAYAAYRLEHPAGHNPHLDPAAVLRVCGQVKRHRFLQDPRDVERAITKVARLLEPVLEAIDANLPER